MNNSDILLKEHVIPLSKKTCVMGILNVTPDSFSDGGRYLLPEDALKKASDLVEMGADIIDVGAESSRPGSCPVSLEAELQRIIPVLKRIIPEVKVPVSVDTYKSEVARRGLELGASIINDITGLRGDPQMPGIIAEFNAGVVIMHMKGTPETMLENSEYTDIVSEVIDFLKESIQIAVNAGIDTNKVIIDPGIGFGKKTSGSLLILKDLNRFSELEKPILIGTSRKSFIGELTGKPVKERLFGTAATCAIAIMNGADILRVHDVKEIIDVAVISDRIMGR